MNQNFLARNDVEDELLSQIFINSNTIGEPITFASLRKKWKHVLIHKITANEC
jgi:hypothetical protein